MNKSNPQQAGLIIKAFAIIQLLSTKRLMSLKNIALQTNMSVSMAYKCIQTLCDLGYAYQQEDTQYYGLTFRLASVCSNMLAHYNITELAITPMQQMGESVKETIHLAIRDDDACVYIHKIDSHFPLRLYSRVGKTAPLHCTGIGKVLLAFEPPHVLESILAKMDFMKYTNNTITDRDKFTAHLAQVRDQGFSEDIEEHEFFIRCLAYPIYDFEHNVVAGISISMPTTRWTPEIQALHHQNLSKASREISYVLGYQQ